MRFLAVSAFSMLLAACASAPPPVQPPALFNDALFKAPAGRVGADDLFALSDGMKRFIDRDIAAGVNAKGRRQALFDAVYHKYGLQLEYDSATTRDAAATFAARSGNCLSLVIMTAAFAKAMDLQVKYQSVDLDDAWNRDGNIFFFVGHVNLTLGRRSIDSGFGRGDEELQIDFLPPAETKGMRTREIRESTIVAMYLNNRAAEALARGKLDDAYAWARAAVERDPGFANSYNTLGAIYHRHGDLAEAHRTLAYALERQPDNVHVMSNLVQVLGAEGRYAEAQELARTLDKIDPNPAFAYFDRGLKAMRQGNYKAARDLFEKEVQRAPYYHEFHFWLGAALIQLGEMDEARRQLALAIQYSTTRSDHDLYSTKLQRISSYRAN